MAAVVENQTIRHWSTALASAEAGSTTSGRPLVNLSFAFNYSLGGYAVWGYHALNILIHAGAALMLFGLLRRTLVLPALGGRYAAAAGPLAFAVAALWALHPLQTESVTYIAQRAESLCGLLFLVTLYCFLRGAALSSAGPWLALSTIACWLGMAAKEVMVAAPVLVLLYDRAFLAGSFAAAWRLRSRYYAALFSAWLLLGWLVVSGGGTRGVSAGFGLGIAPGHYLLTQAGALVLYLCLSFWPHPLVLDYGTGVVQSLGDVWWQGLAVLGLLAGTGWALCRRPMVGFVGAWFFLILAPSSSIVPVITQTVAEHRMYLPLAAPLLLFGLILVRLLPRACWAVSLMVLLVFILLTGARNRDYLSAVTIWRDTAARQPANARAHINLAEALLASGIAQALVPPDGTDRTNQLNEALEHATIAARLRPDDASAYANIGVALVQLGRPASALAPLREAARLRPGDPALHTNLGGVLAQLDHWSEAGRPVS